MMQLRLNPGLDPRAHAQDYAEKRCVQIPDFFDAESAAALETVIASLPWRLLLQDETTKNLVLTREQIAAIAPERRRALEDGMRQRAADGVGHCYLVYPMIEAALEGYDPGHPIHALTEFLNSRPMIEFARELIRLPAVSKLDAHASCYLPGHYLNRHIDDGLIKERKAAYTIGLSREWKPDWGGMLLVYDENDDVRIGMRPRFNALTVFDGLVPHSVTSIAPFAPRPRYTVAGWFRDDPPYRKGVD
jgi:Rps23 Pro-64 3,4-dihydroxylase Tpa1-like proline 4-hydroxylase